MIFRWRGQPTNRFIFRRDLCDIGVGLGAGWVETLGRDLSPPVSRESSHWRAETQHRTMYSHQTSIRHSTQYRYKLNCLHCPVALITSCKYPTALSCQRSEMFVSNICSCGQQLPVGRTNTEPRINRKINRWLDYSVGSNGEFHYKSDGKITLHLQWRVLAEEYIVV